MLQSAGMALPLSVLEQESTYALLFPLSPPRVFYDAVMLNLMLLFFSSGSSSFHLLMHTFLFKKEQISNKVCYEWEGKG